MLVSWMYSVCCRCVAAVIDPVICCCGVVTCSARGLGGAWGVCVSSSRCSAEWLIGGSVSWSVLLCWSRNGYSCGWSCAKSCGAVSGISAVAEGDRSVCSWVVCDQGSSSLWWASSEVVEVSGGKNWACMRSHLVRCFRGCGAKWRGVARACWCCRL